MDSSFITTVKRTIDEYYKQLEDIDYDTEITVEDAILKIIQDINSSEVKHCLVEEYVPESPEMTCFITIYCFKE
jgi:hypothetical protein